MKLGKRIWKAVEGPQGYAFISDDIVSASDDEAYAVAKGALHQARIVVRRLERILKDYYVPRKPVGDATEKPK